MLRRKQLIPIGIVAFWLVMTGLLLQREVLVPRVTTDLIESPREPSDIWMGIYTPTAQGTEQRIGYLHTASMPYDIENDQGTRYSLTLKMATAVLSYPAEILLKGSSRVSLKEGLRNFTFTVQSKEGHELRADGEAVGDKIQVAIETAGETFPMELPVGPDLMVSGGMGTTTLNVPSLNVGDEVYTNAFDPLTFTYNQNVRITCIDTGSFEYDGDLIPVKVLTTTAGGITNTIWVTLDEEIVRVETPFGFVLRRIPQEEALAELKPGEMGDLLDVVAIRAQGETPFRGAKSMQFRLTGIPDTTGVPTGAIQRLVQDNIYEIAPPQGPAPQGPALEKPGPFLHGDAFVQVDHHRIVDHAELITTDLTNNWDKAQAIYRWVYLNINKIIVMSLPSALDVLQTMEGDCNEHTVLYTALARAAGIPTKIAIGIVWSDELNGFYYHAWPEVYVGQWVPIDPTLGQPVADATHIKFIEGGIDSWAKLAGFLGQVQLEILDIQ